MSETWTEYRAVYQRPASYLDKEYTGTGYVVERTGPYPSKAEALYSAHYRAEETHAFVTGYEQRQVTATGWEQA